MKKFSHIASIVLKSLIIIAGVAGVLMSVLESTNSDEIFSYYTIQSNILCVLLFCVLLVFECFGGAQGLQKSHSYFVIKFACTMCITVTMLVYNLLLAPTLPDNGFSFSNTLVHIIVPLLTILDCLIFDCKGRLKWFDPFIWTLLPIAYLVYIAVHAAGGGVFHTQDGVFAAPYFFLRPEVLGWGGVIVYCLGIFAAFLILAFAVFGLDRLLGNITEKVRVHHVGISGTPAKTETGIGELPLQENSTSDETAALGQISRSDTPHDDNEPPKSE